MVKLFNVSNRLPVTYREGKFQKSSGGLVAALEGLGSEQLDLRWIGWPGGTVEEGERTQVARQLNQEFKALPVFLSPEEMEGHYEGLSNSSLWPLLHAMPSYLKFEAGWWSVYEAVNRKFAEVVLSQAEDGDLVWVHDYQLMLVPQMLREAKPGLKIGFFLHTPFPPADVFRYFPRRSEAIVGLLGADVVGFHTFSYLRHFHEACARLVGTGADGSGGEVDQVVYEGHVSALGVFPIGINADKFEQEIASADFVQRKEKLLSSRNGRKVVLSVERLDYTKGILHRLDAIDLYLSRLELEARDKVEFIFVSVPTREKVEDYRDLRQEVELRIGRLNGKYATLHNSPIHFIHGTVDFPDLVALYATADVALVTPLIDGMNLVAKEFIAAHADEQGVLVLSEFAGAAEEMVSALHVNPHDPTAVADAIGTALAMSDAEKRARAVPMRRRVMQEDARFWAKNFVDALSVSRPLGDGVTTAVASSPAAQTARQRAAALQDLVTTRLRHALREKQGAAMLLDYDGTLREIVRDPTGASPTPETRRLLDRLAAAPGVEVAVVSGRTREDLELFLGHYPFALVAEHGAAVRAASPVASWTEIAPDAPQTWKDPVMAVLRSYERLTPGSFIEVKRTGLVWHYRNADRDLGEFRARRLVGDLATATANLTVNVRHGKKIVEIGDASVSKGAAAKRLLGERAFGFVLCAGDDTTDETFFQPPPTPDAITIKVGPGQTAAKYRLGTPGELRRLIEEALNHVVM